MLRVHLVLPRAPDGQRTSVRADANVVGRALPSVYTALRRTEVWSIRRVATRNDSRLATVESSSHAATVCCAEFAHLPQKTPTISVVFSSSAADLMCDSSSNLPIHPITLQVLAPANAETHHARLASKRRQMRRQHSGLAGPVCQVHGYSLPAVRRRPPSRPMPLCLEPYPDIWCPLPSRSSQLL